MRLLTILLLAFTCPAIHAQKFAAINLSCEHKKNPIGIDVAQPRMSWMLTGPGRNIAQSAYQIRVAKESSFSKRSIVWESGKQTSDQSLLQAYQGPALESATRYYWQVMTWDAANKASSWSETAFWETGLLNASDWKAEWIQPNQDTTRHEPGILVRKLFLLTKKVVSARAYVTSHGFYELYINGKKVGDEVLTPGWTSYNKRLQYQVYDVTSMLSNGENAVGAMLGDGWFRSALGWATYGLYGKKLELLCQLKLKFSDDSEEIIPTNNTWKSSTEGPITLDGIYDGEWYDARKEQKGWSQAGFNDASWKPVSALNTVKNNLIATQTVPVREIEEIKAVRVFKTPKGLTVVDLGQNMVGWVRLKVKGNAGATVTIRHAEVLDKYGDFYTDNLRAATATAKYTLRGGEEEVYEPRFSFFGFRYVAVDGFPGELKPENITGVVVHSDMRPTGSFECSNPLINQLQHNIQWGQKGNFLDVPTDCPQRDERLGWTGDAQAFVRSAAYNMDVAAFFTKWMKDVAADQFADGGVPFVIPNVLGGGTSAGWGDVATIAPWTIYQVFGDKRILETQYPSMKAYVDYINKTAGESHLWKGGSVFGDWLFYKSMNQTENDGYTSPDMIATMFFAYSASILSKTAGVLGNSNDQKFYADLFDRIKDAFNKNYLTNEGRISSESQTAYVLALNFDLLSAANRTKAAAYLVDDIKGRGNHLSTGFLGTPYLCHVLSENGYTDVAYDLLLQQTYPSWLYPVKMGATTIWERWDGQKTDSTFQDIGMNSFNHYAYGAIGDWMYRVVAGLEIGQPGYKTVLIQPSPGKKLDYAKAGFESSYGKIESGWEKKDGKLIVRVRIPANTNAIIRLPNSGTSTITEGGSAIDGKFKKVSKDGDVTVIETGSGVYVFEYAFP